MKKKYSPKWKKSKQKRKQKKHRFNAPLHSKHKMLSSNLSKELRKKHGKRSFPIRKDDMVVIMRGNFKKKKGKVIRVDLKTGKIFVEGIQKTKKDGSKINIPLNASNLQIQELNLEDKKRRAAIERKQEREK